MKNLTLVAIDGLGIAIDFYIKIFELCNKEIHFEKNILFTAAKSYSSDIPENLQIDFIEIPELTYQEFNKFCLTEINPFITTSHIIMVQTDGFICNGKNWKDSYFEYDYIGQPWLDDGSGKFHWVRSYEESVGEGGFTLRSKKLLETLSKIDKIAIENYFGNEDVFISSYARDFLNSNGCKFATPEIGTEFCAGLNNFNFDNLQTSFGFHANEYVEEALNIYKKRYDIDYIEDITNYKK
jgi:hypothetical protein